MRARRKSQQEESNNKEECFFKEGTCKGGEGRRENQGGTCPVSSRCLPEGLGGEIGGREKEKIRNSGKGKKS